MNKSPHLPKTIKGRPSSITLNSIYEYLESLEKHREEREIKLQTELEAMLENKFTSLENKIQKQIENKITILENKMETLEVRLHAIENQSQYTNQTSQQEDGNTLESLKMIDMIKELEAKVNNNSTLNTVADKLDIKPIKEEMKKLIELDHERNKRALNLIIFGLKEEEDEDTLAIAQTELYNRLQIETTCLTEATRLGKLTENKGRLIRVKVSSTDQKHDILSKTSSLKGTGIFINEDLIPEDQAELRKEVQKVKEARKEGKWAIIRNRKAVIRDRNQKDSNK